MKNLFSLNNLFMKIFSVTLALIVWAVVKMQIGEGVLNAYHRKGSIETLSLTRIPIYILQGSDDTNNYELYPSYATVEIAGENTDILGATADEILLYVTIDPSEVLQAPLSANTNLVQIPKKIKYSLPSEYTIVQLVPTSVRLMTKVPPVKDIPSVGVDISDEEL